MVLEAVLESVAVTSHIEARLLPVVVSQTLFLISSLCNLLRLTSSSSSCGRRPCVEQSEEQQEISWLIPLVRSWDGELLSHLPHKGQVVATDDVEAKVNKLDGGVDGECAFVGFREDYVLNLVVAWDERNSCVLLGIRKRLQS